MYQPNTRTVVGKAKPHISQNMLYRKYKIPKINTLLQKHTVMHHIRQSCKSWQIQTERQKLINRNELMWQEKWGFRKKLHGQPDICTPEQQAYLARRIHATKSQTKQNYIITLLQQEELPGKNAANKRKQGGNKHAHPTKRDKNQ